MILKNKLLKNIGLLVGGTAIAQAITFLATLYLTTIYSPDSFGLLSLGTSIVSLLVPLTTLRYDKAIVLAKDEKETNGLITISFLIALLFFLSLLVVALIVYLCDLIKNESHYILLILVPVGVLLFGFMNVFQMYFEKKSRFKITSSVAVIDAVSKVSFQYGLNSILPTLGMFVGYIVALTINTVFYFVKSKALFKKRFFEIDKEYLFKVAEKYNKFPKYFTWSNIIDSASQNVCSLTFPFLFSLGILGNFSIAYKIVRLPALLISMATRRTYYPKAVELYAKNKSQFKVFYTKASLTLIAISIIPVLIFQLYAEELFGLFFNPEWQPAAEYAKIILWYVFANFCNSLAHENMIIFGLQKLFLIIEVIWFLLSLLLIYIAFLLGKPFLAVIFYALSGVFMEVLVFIIQHKKGFKATN